MKNSFKKVVLIFTVACMITSLCACSKKENNTSEHDAVSTNAEIKEDYMYKYLKGLPSDSDRNEFVDFWKYSITYCGCIENELKNVNNSNNYEFDPTDEQSIPEDIANVYSFSDIKIKNRNDKHKNFKLTINGCNVKLTYDGVEFYPTTYGYTEVQNLIDSLKSE